MENFGPFYGRGNSGPIVSDKYVDFCKGEINKENHFIYHDIDSTADILSEVTSNVNCDRLVGGRKEFIEVRSLTNLEGHFNISLHEPLHLFTVYQKTNNSFVAERPKSNKIKKTLYCATKEQWGYVVCTRFANQAEIFLFNYSTVAEFHRIWLQYGSRADRCPKSAPVTSYKDFYNHYHFLVKERADYQRSHTKFDFWERSKIIRF